MSACKEHRGNPSKNKSSNWLKRTTNKADVEYKNNNNYTILSQETCTTAKKLRGYYVLFRYLIHSVQELQENWSESTWLDVIEAISVTEAVAEGEPLFLYKDLKSLDSSAQTTLMFAIQILNQKALLPNVFDLK